MKFWRWLRWLATLAFLVLLLWVASAGGPPAAHSDPSKVPEKKFNL